MPYCPTCKVSRAGDFRFCLECGTELVSAPPTGAPVINQVRGDTGLDRSVSQTVVVTPGPPAGPEGLPWDYCPIDGVHVRRDHTFRCRRCGRSHLCREHLDSELRVCEECAAELRRANRKELEPQLAPLRAEAAARLQAGELAEGLLVCGRALGLCRDDPEALRQAEAGRAALRKLAEQARHWHGMSDEVTAQTARLGQELQRLRASGKEAQDKGTCLARDLAKAQAELAGWRQRAEQAEAQLRQIEERERAAAEARRRAEEEARRAPVWKQIGIEMVLIPAGDFLYGENKQIAHLPDYFLARTPVTNAQYQAFVEATGYPAPEHWPGGRIPNGKEDHPVVYVSWEDAHAFCQWAGCRLPSEQEWEKGARARIGREYPWGDSWQPGRCNSSEAGTEDTTPVGKYPQGASPYGLLDMAGNVWECCEDWYDNERELRVVRGGSWRWPQIDVRSALRFNLDPSDTSTDVGFRCSVSSTSSP